MKNDTRPIGLFDSGIGGTTIWKAIHDLLPYENTIFIGDSLNAPYGQKSKEEIINLSRKNVDWLLKHNVKAIVVACNTATTNAISQLRNEYDIPFIGVEPAIKPAALHTKTGKVGVLATQSTLQSNKYIEAQYLYPHVKFINQIGYKIVQLIEDGALYSYELEDLLKQYIQPMLDENIDYLVLGCTHYPYLKPIIKKFLPESVIIIDSGEAVANRTKKVLEDNQLLKTDNILGKSLFFTNKNEAILNYFIKEFGVAHKIDF